jgi:Zn-dependent protease
MAVIVNKMPGHYTILMELNFIFAIIVLIMSVVIHEVSHGAVAEKFGDPTARLEGRITLNPLRHIDPIGSVIVPLLTFFAGGIIFGWARPVPVNPYNMSNRRLGELAVAFAGPASNLILALVFGLAIRYGMDYGLSKGFIELSILVVFVNLTLAVFNLIPIPPLDGSKILFSLLPPHLEYIRNFIERFSLILVLVLLVFLWQFITPLIPFLFKLITGL